MRVFIWGNCYPRIGGIETFVAHLSAALADRAIASAIIGDGPVSSMISPQGIPSRMVPMLEPIRAMDPAGILAAIRMIRQAIRDFAPDVIHYNTAGAEIMLFDKVMQSLDIPVVATLHNNALADVRVVTLQRLFDRCSAVTAVSDFVRAAMAGSAARTPGDILLIPNAIPSQAAPVTRPADGHVLALGRMIPEKGFDTLVEAFALVRAGHRDARLTIAGNGPEREALRQRAIDLGIADAVALPGWIEPAGVHDAMASAAVVAMPSRWQEPFGLVALESGHAARPCVATRVGGLPSIIVDDETGRLVPPDQPHAMAAAISRLLAHPAEADALGRNARQRMASHFDFDRMIDLYVAAFARACPG